MMESNGQGFGRRLRAGFNRVIYALWNYSDQLDELRKMEDEEKAEKKLNDMADRFADKYRSGDPVWSEYLKLEGKYALPNITGLSEEKMVRYRELDIQLFVENRTRRRDLSRAQVKLRWKKEKEALEKMEDEEAAEKKLDALIEEIGPKYEALEEEWTDYIRLDGELALNGRLKFEKSIRRTELQIKLYGSNKARRRHLKQTRAKARWNKERAALKKIKDKKDAEKKLDALVEQLGPKYDAEKEQAWTEYIRLDGELALNELLSAEKSLRRQELRIDIYCDCSSCKKKLRRLRLKKRWKDEIAALKEETEPAAHKLEMLIQELGPQYEGKAEAWTEYIRLDSERQLGDALPHEKAVRRQELLIDLYGETKKRREKLESLQRKMMNSTENAEQNGAIIKELTLTEGTHDLE